MECQIDTKGMVAFRHGRRWVGLARPRERLIRVRKDAGLTQLQLARIAKISRSYYVHVEKGRRTPSLPVALRIAKALNTSIHVLFQDLQDLAPKTSPSQVSRSLRHEKEEFDST